MSNQDNNVKYNDQHTIGIGYLNRGRTVTPKQGEPYEAVSLSGLGGRVDSPIYTYYDCSRIIGNALDKYLLMKADINNDDVKVLVRFKVADGKPDSYVIKDKQTGEDVRRHVIKCRLLNITWAKIGDHVVEFATDEDDDQPSADQNPEAQSVHEQQATQPNPESNTNQEAVASLFSDDELDEFVKLDRDDPQFLAKKSELKLLGYEWDSNEVAWYRPAA